MRTVAISEVLISDRQRKDRPVSELKTHISELKASILSKGLMHAPLLFQAPNGLQLIAGECRLTAMRELHEDGLSFNYDGRVVPAGEIPYSLIGDLQPADLAEAELEENVLRAQLEWIDHSEARVLVHKLRELQAEKQGAPTPTLSSTATHLAEKSGKTFSSEMITLQRSLAVSAHKENPRVKAAKSLTEAHRIVLDMTQNAFRQQLHALGSLKTEHELHLGNCLEVLPKLPAAQFDLILTDPPYGIGADSMKKTAKHFYDDSPENALEVCKFIISEGFRLLKPRGHIFMFTDVDIFLELREHAQRQGYSIWRTPVVWHKGDDGHSPLGRGGFIRTYEIFLVLIKGQKEFKSATPDVKSFKRALRSDRVHAAEKPVDLLSHLISLCCDPGDHVLDPTCGSGPIFEAATKQKVKATGIEIDPEYHAIACGRLQGTPEEPTPEEVAESNASAARELLG